MASNSREARRRKILERGSDRLAFITGQSNNVPPPTSPSSDPTSLSQSQLRTDDTVSPRDQIRTDRETGSLHFLYSDSPMNLPRTMTTRGELFWGYLFVIIGSVSFFGFVVFAVIIASNDKYYYYHYCFLVPLTLPVVTVSVYFHWLSMKLFKHA